VAVDKSAVAELVVYGVTNSQIGEAFGVSGQYIANLVREDEETQELMQKKATDMAVRQHNNKVTEEIIERDLLEKIKAQIDMSDSLIESVKCLQLMKDIQGKNRAAQHGAGAELPASITLNMGDATEVVIQRTGNNEIISIAGRDMAPMPAKRVIDMAKESQDNGKKEDAKREQRNPIEAEYSEGLSVEAL